MKPTLRAALAGLAGLLLVVSSAHSWSQDTKRHEDRSREDRNRDERSREIVSEDSTGPVYNPPHRGAPGGRVGGGTRGEGREEVKLWVLAPDHTGLTTKAQPSLFWFISETKFPVELTIVDPGKDAPVLETRIPEPIECGVYRVRLADYRLELSPKVAYQWSVAVIRDPARRARDILASATIQRLEPGQELSKLAAADGKALAFEYAKASIWYDALEAIDDLIKRSPGDKTPRLYRAALLAQVGLAQVDEQLEKERCARVRTSGLHSAAAFR
jgi:hypothetical protein